MSAPVGRETPTRVVKTQGRKVSALSKRPAPAPPEGTFEWAYFRAFWTGEAPIANLSGTSRSVDWGPLVYGASNQFTPGWEIFGNTASGGTDVFRPRDTGAAISPADDELVRYIDVLRPGIVTCTWGLDFDLTGDAANGDVYSFFTEHGPFSINGDVIHDTKAAPSGVEGSGLLSTTWHRIFPQLDPFDSGAQQIRLRTLTSWSGPTSGEDVSDGFIDISWIGITTETGEF